MGHGAGVLSHGVSSPRAIFGDIIPPYGGRGNAGGSEGIAGWRRQVFGSTDFCFSGFQQESPITAGKTGGEGARRESRVTGRGSPPCRPIRGWKLTARRGPLLSYSPVQVPCSTGRGPISNGILSGGETADCADFADGNGVRLPRRSAEGASHAKGDGGGCEGLSSGRRIDATPLIAGSRLGLILFAPSLGGGSADALRFYRFRVEAHGHADNFALLQSALTPEGRS
jgi:hypothetical protein